MIVQKSVYDISADNQDGSELGEILITPTTRLPYRVHRWGEWKVNGFGLDVIECVCYWLDETKPITFQHEMPETILVWEDDRE